MNYPLKPSRFTMSQQMPPFLCLYQVPFGTLPVEYGILPV